MRFAVYKGEKLTDLVGRLYQIKGPRAKSIAKEAEEALLQANPRLRDLKEVPEGVVILVPEVATVNAAEETHPAAAIVDELAAEVRRALDEVRVTLDDARDRKVEAANTTLELLKDPNLKELAGQDPDLKERLPNIAKQAQADIKAADTLRKFQEQALGQLTKDFDTFAERFSGGKQEHKPPGGRQRPKDERDK